MSFTPAQKIIGNNGFTSASDVLIEKYKQEEANKPLLEKIVEKTKSVAGGFASGVAGPVLTAEDYLGRKIVDAVGSDTAKANLAKTPSLNDQFKTEMGGDKNPNTYGGSQIAGEIAGLAAPSAAAGKIAAKGAELAGVGKTTAKIIGGATEGAAFTAGTDLAENKKSDLQDFAINSGIGALIPGGAAIAKTVGEKLPGRIINSLIKPLSKDFAYGKNPGKTIAEMGITANNFDDLIGKIKTNLDVVGSNIGQVVSQSPNLQKIDLSYTLKPIDEAISAANKTPRTNASLISRLESVKSDLVDNIQNGIDPQSYKGLVGDLTKWTGSVSDDQAVNKALKQVYGTTRQSMDEVLSKELSPEEFATYKKNSENYGNLLSAKNAAEYRDKILERQNLISFGAKNAGLLSALTTAVATGGGAAPIIIAGLAGTAIDKAAATPAFKTRLASLLTKLAPSEVQTFFEKIPTAKALFNESQLNDFIGKIKKK